MKCTLCFGDRTHGFLDLGQQPLANKYPTEAQFATEDFFPLKVFFCNDCKNVQLGTFISRERMFADYYYLSSVNLGLVRHFETWARQLASAKFVLDIGSNDGIFLKPLSALGVRAVGVDPSVNVSKIANDAGLTTIVAFFDSPTALKIKKEYGMPDVVVASSIFTHLEDPHSFIDAVKEVMAPQGAFIIEVEYIGNILRDVQFERFYLDRIFYYSLSSLNKLFARHGMQVSDVEEIAPHGGSLRVTAHRAGEGPATNSRVSQFLKKEGAELTPQTMSAFKHRVDDHISAFKTKLEDYKKKGLRVAGYGSPARVATICNYGHIGPSLIDFIIDDSPLKQHRHTPGTHIPIYPKSHLATHTPDVLVVFAHEYLTDIKTKTSDRTYQYLLPIPPREV